MRSLDTKPYILLIECMGLYEITVNGDPCKARYALDIQLSWSSCVWLGRIPPLQPLSISEGRSKLACASINHHKTFVNDGQFSGCFGTKLPEASQEPKLEYPSRSLDKSFAQLQGAESGTPSEKRR